MVVQSGALFRTRCAGWGSKLGNMTTALWIWLAVGIGLAVLAGIFIRRWWVRRKRSAARHSARLPDAHPADSPSGELHPWIVMNPSKHRDPEAFKKQVESAAERLGLPRLHWLETSVEDPGTGQAVEALTRGATVVVAAGGDGTVRAVAAGLAHSGVRMGILPVGTGNLLARNLGIPVDDLDEAVAVAFGAGHRTVDIAWFRAEDVTDFSGLPAEGALLRSAWEVHGGTLPERLRHLRSDEYAFAVIAGVGFDGETMAKTDSELKKSIGWAAYIVAALQSMRLQTMNATVRLHRPESLEHDPFLDVPGLSPVGAGVLGGTSSENSDEEVVELKAKAVMFANCGELPFFTLAPRATVNDGMLDVVAVDTQVGLVGWASLGWKVLAQGLGLRALNLPLSTGQIAFRQAPAVSVTTKLPHTVQVDGDAVGTASTVHTWNDYNALDMSVPRTRPVSVLESFQGR